MRPRSVFAAATLLTTVAVMSNAVVVAQTSKEWSQCTDGEGPIADVVISGPVAAPEATVRCGFGLLQQRAVLGQECRPANNSFGWKAWATSKLSTAYRNLLQIAVHAHRPGRYLPGNVFRADAQFVHHYVG